MLSANKTPNTAEGKCVFVNLKRIKNIKRNPSSNDHSLDVPVDIFQSAVDSTESFPAKEEE